MKKDYLIIILAFVLVGLIGFITYDNFFKPNTKCNVNKTTTTTTDSTKTDSKTEKTSDERYKEYLSNLSKSIETKYKDFVDPGNAGIYNTSSYKNDDLNLFYSLTINHNKELLLTDYSGKYKDYKIADNVVSFYRVHLANGSYYIIYYITNDGKVYSLSLESILNENKNIESSEVNNVKNIVEIKEGGSEMASFTIFVDIDGNIYTPDVAE